MVCINVLWKDVRKLLRKCYSMEGWVVIYIMKWNFKENSGWGCFK